VPSRATGHVVAAVRFSCANRQLAFGLIAPKTLRLAAEVGEIEAFHPLSDGPWIFARASLITTAAQSIAERAAAITVTGNGSSATITGAGSAVSITGTSSRNAR
jgi:hypothetical protein